MRQIVQKLPMLNRKVVYYLVDFLKRVSECIQRLALCHALELITCRHAHAHAMHVTACTMYYILICFAHVFIAVSSKQC